MRDIGTAVFWGGLYIAYKVSVPENINLWKVHMLRGGGLSLPAKIIKDEYLIGGAGIIVDASYRNGYWVNKSSSKAVSWDYVGSSSGGIYYKGKKYVISNVIASVAMISKTKFWVSSFASSAISFTNIIKLFIVEVDKDSVVSKTQVASVTIANIIISALSYHHTTNEMVIDRDAENLYIVTSVAFDNYSDDFTFRVFDYHLTIRGVMLPPPDDAGVITDIPIIYESDGIIFHSYVFEKGKLYAYAFKLRLEGVAYEDNTIDLVSFEWDFINDPIISSSIMEVENILYFIYSNYYHKIFIYRDSLNGVFLNLNGETIDLKPLGLVEGSPAFTSLLEYNQCGFAEIKTHLVVCIQATVEPSYNGHVKGLLTMTLVFKLASNGFATLENTINYDIRLGKENAYSRYTMSVTN